MLKIYITIYILLYYEIFESSSSIVCVSKELRSIEARVSTITPVT